jgi:hypothetical protein
VTFTLTIWHVVAALVAMAGGGGTIGAVVAAGVLHRWLVPAIRTEIITHEGESATAEARKAFVRAVLDDQVARDDGIIRRHTRDHEARLTTAIESVQGTNALLVEELAQMRGVLAVLVERMPPAPSSRERNTPMQPFTPRRPTPAHGSPTR